MTSGWAAGMQSISVRSARGGAIAAALCLCFAPLVLCLLLVGRRATRTGDGGFLERCSGLSRRWRKRLSACARGVARCTALLLPLQVEPPSRDASLDRGLRSAQTTRLRMVRQRKKNAIPELRSSAQGDLWRLYRANPRTTDQTITAVVPPLPLLSLPKSSALAVPRLRSSASLMPKPLPGLAAGPRGMRSSERSGWQRRGCSSWAGGLGGAATLIRRRPPRHPAAPHALAAGRRDAGAAVVVRTSEPSRRWSNTHTHP